MCKATNYTVQMSEGPVICEGTMDWSNEYQVKSGLSAAGDKQNKNSHGNGILHSS